MKRDEIMNAIKTLARGNGAYGRLLQAIEEMENGDDFDQDQIEQWWQKAEAQKFKTPVDFVLWWEA